MTLTLCCPACAHHRKTLSIRLLAVGFNKLDGRSGLFRPALLQTDCVYAAGLQRSRWYQHRLVSGMRTGSRAVAQPANGWLLHGNSCACLIPAREPVLVIMLVKSTGSRVLASANFLLSNVAYKKLNLTISLHGKQIFNVFLF